MAHSATISWHTWRSAAAVEAAGETIRPSWAAQLQAPAVLDGAQRALVEAGRDHARTAERWGLLEDPELDLHLAWFELLLGEQAEVERRLVRLGQALPGSAQVRFDHGTWLASQGRLDEAVTQLRQAISLLPRFHADNNGRILGRGLSVSPRDSDLKTALQAALARHGRE